MSMYLEIPDLDQTFPYRCFLNDGMGIVYPHWHKEIEFIYAVKGNVTIGFGEKLITLEEEEVIFFPSGEPHYFFSSPESERYVYQFDLKLFDEIILRKNEKSLLRLFEQGEVHSRLWPRELAKTVKELLIDLYRVSITHPLGENYLVVSHLNLLIAEFYRCLPQSSQALSVKPDSLQRKETLNRLNQVFEYVETAYRTSISIEEISKHVGFSPYYFTRFFKKHTGQTFMQFLSTYRVNQAKFILVNEQIPMTEVAERSGFSSVKTFHHVFKQQLGQSPLQYQKQIEKETLESR